MRGTALLIGALGVVGLAGCSTKTATPTSASRSAACLPSALTLFGSPRVPPKELRTSLEATILSRFALLRRPRVPGDEPSGGDLGGDLDRTYTLASFYPAYVRLLAVWPDGRRYYAVPAFGQPEDVPARCSPERLRRKLVEQQRRRLGEPVYCVIATGGSASRRVPGCESFAQVERSARAFFVSDLLGEPTMELVPDGVAAVRIRYRDTAAIVALVKENAFLLTPPPAPHDRLTAYMRGLLPKILGQHVTQAQQLTATREWNRAYGGTYPTRIEWLDHAGGVVRALSQPDESTSATSVGDLRSPVEG